MANNLLTIDMITRETLRVAHETATFIDTADRQYDNTFARTGAKQGDSLRVRLPTLFTRRRNSRIMNVQDVIERQSTITVAIQDGIDMKFNSVELALDIDEFSRRNIEPAVKQLVSGIEGDFLDFATKQVWNVVGTPGTALTDLAVPGLARARLNQGLAPKDRMRCIQMDSITMSTVVNGVSGYFNPSGAIGEQYREGFIARTAMADWYENERVATISNSSDVSGATLDNYTVTEGATSLTVTGLSAAPNEGMVFTIAGVFAVHPETKARYPHLQQFVVGAGATTTEIPISPAIYSAASGALQNVSGLPATNAPLTFVGSASTDYVQPLMYHREAFQFITADLPLTADSESCVRRVQDGISMRVWKGSDIITDEMLMRIDILYGFAALRPEWACRMIGAANA